jgi:Fe-S oxidoreductase
MATLDEADTTRARANVVRLAISGQLGPEGLTDAVLYPVLDLCLECKACKSECPTGVDMARLKSEFLHQYHRRHGAPLRTRLLASAADMALWGSLFAPLSNSLVRSRPGRWLNEKALGIDRRRDPPEFARQTFATWWKQQPAPRSGDNGQPTVALFTDTFTNHYEPRHGMAVVRLAERLCARVVVPPRVCCGRPLISKGLLDRARSQAAATVETLYPLAEAGTPIVFCEPGCYSAVRDDHPLLLRGELRRKATAVSRACVTFEEWFEPALDTAGVRLSGGPRSILLHGHCHQKALVGITPTVRLLSRIPDCEIVDADSGCCGMAGSFGYEREHYDVSEAVGERKLFPAIRERIANRTVIAPGFSCRQQISHFTGVKALSVMELLEKLIER